MKKKSYAFACALALAALGVQAQTTAPAAPAPAASAAEAPKSDWSISGNAGLFSDYRFRGVSQTNRKPAFQGGFDIAHASGFYVGNWNSNVDSAFYNGANIEMDFYGGFKYPVGPVTLDGGVYYYYYPGSGDVAGSFKINNTELYIGASYQTYSIKYSYAVSDFFGIDDSKGSWYLEANGTYDLGNGFGLVGHLGYQALKKNARFTEIGGTTLVDNVTDWKIGATYDWNSWVFGAAYVSTNRDFTAGTAAISNRNISSSTVVVSVTKTF
ncbi:MAG TPA: TorF family putative porin [Caldimonas sp.]|jgi:uncharacterized protein (TIGR02001 family)|nr:TorF family putative porin [Caldimonas sp.]HEX4235573.1 TorF family putative porin [Caldimonas sp.]